MRDLPQVTPWLYRGFERYVVRMLRRHFHAVRFSWDPQLTWPVQGPVLVFANHPGWWDPLMGVVLRRHCFPEHRLYAPMDAEALRHYAVLKRLGFYGVDREPRQGAKQFLEVSRRLLQDPQATVWVTPQGRFVDVRETAAFEPGLAHLASRLSAGIAVPLAIEYAFWNERDPEALLRFGKPIDLATSGLDKVQWQQRFETSLHETQAELAALSLRREPSDFQTLVSGRPGVAGLYDWLRYGQAWWRREAFRPGHTDLVKQKRAA